jgi:cytochrome P450
MNNLFTDDVRRNPYPLYAKVREVSPVFRDPESGLWMIFDYAGVKRALDDHETFSSKHGPDWMIFSDPPRHTKLRALISKGFTPRSVANLEPRIRELSRQLLDRVIERGEMDLAADFAVPLPMMVIAEMMGIPVEDRHHFGRWNDVLLNMSYAVLKVEGAQEAVSAYIAQTQEMGVYLEELLKRKRAEPRDDLLSRLVAAEVDGERLTHAEMVGFFQLLLLAGAETTTNLINNAVLCFVAHPEQLALLRGRMELLPSAIEEVLRYRSPLQWMYRKARCDVEVHGRLIPSGSLVLLMMGAANHDPAVFAEPGRFDISREPNPHVAFGHGVHFCMGAPLARLEARVALAEFLGRVKGFGLASGGPWEPRRGLHVHGPNRLHIRFERESAA